MNHNLTEISKQNFKPLVQAIMDQARKFRHCGGKTYDPTYKELEELVYGSLTVAYVSGKEDAVVISPETKVIALPSEEKYTAELAPLNALVSNYIVAPAIRELAKYKPQYVSGFSSLHERACTAVTLLLNDARRERKIALPHSSGQDDNALIIKVLPDGKGNFVTVFENEREAVMATITTPLNRIKEPYRSCAAGIA